MAKAILTAERLRAVVHYDPETGRFTRTVQLARRHRVGDRADFLIATGWLKGYYRVAVDSQRYLAHRVAWLYVNGRWPDGVIDHINGNRSDNRIENLRDGTQAQNMQNRRKAQSNCISGILGVHLHRETGRWVARLQTGGVGRHIGLFATKEEAHEAYLREKRKFHSFCSI